jgi:lysophospholipase L1-like esterase
LVIGIAEGIPGRGRRRSPLFSVGPFSDANYLSAMGAGPTMGAGKCIVFSWYQAATPTHDEYIVSRVDPSHGFYAGGSVGTKLFYLGGTGISAANPPLVFDSSMAGLWHTIAWGMDATYHRHSTSGGGVLLTPYGGPYVPPIGTTPFQIGRLHLTTFPASTEEAGWILELPFLPTDAQIQELSYSGRRGGFPPSWATAAASVYWSGADFSPTAPTSTSKGSSPVTLTLNGSLSKQARSNKWITAIDDSESSVGYHDSVRDIVQTDANGVRYRRRNEFARRKFTTDSPVLSIEVVSVMAGLIPSYATIEVQVDGAHYATVTAQVSNIAHSVDVKLPGGLHTVTLIEGTQASPAAAPPIYTTSIRSISVPSGYTISIVMPTAPAYRMLVWGNSIPGGGNGSNPQVIAWPMLARAHGAAVSMEAWGSRSISEDYVAGGNSMAAIAAVLDSLCDGTVGNIVIDELETNSYGLNRESAATFGARHLSAMQLFHARRPDVDWLSLGALARVAPASEAANAFGNTLADYTAQKSANITTMANAKYRFADAHAWASAGSYTLSGAFTKDGIHINDAGHVEYEAQVRTLVGWY